jgi:hypothetical protein
MKRDQKVQRLLDENRRINHTFATRAADARRIVSADDFGLDAIAIALGVRFDEKTA